MDLKTQAASAIYAASSVVVMTGAGISAESGIPTFREAQVGLWSQYKPEELATPEAYLRNPRLVWDWYDWRRKMVNQAAPNEGHIALAQLEMLVDNFTLVTQNVDGLHRAAGTNNLIELHGNITTAKCFDNHHPTPAWVDRGGEPPTCQKCDSYLRPNVVWFGEPLPPEPLERAFAAARSAGVFVSVGTSSLVQPAASLAYEALNAGAKIIEINPKQTPLTPDATISIQASAGEALPEIAGKVSQLKSD